LPTNSNNGSRNELQNWPQPNEELQLQVGLLQQSQEELRRAEENTRLIIDTTLDAVITMDAQGMITSWNKQAEIVFGWSEREAIGQHMPEMIIPEQQRMAHERGLRHFLDSGDGPILRRRIEFTAVRRSGVEFPVELEVTPVKVGENWVFSGFIRDITDSKLAEKQIAGERIQPAPDDRNNSGDALERYSGRSDRLLQCKASRLHRLISRPNHG